MVSIDSIYKSHGKFHFDNIVYNSSRQDTTVKDILAELSNAESISLSESSDCVLFSYLVIVGTCVKILEFKDNKYLPVVSYRNCNL